jgi:CheY-like chemotaxis protein
VAHIDVASNDAAPAGTPRTVSVLVVDDDPDARDMMDAVLTRAGYAVVTAADGLEALALLRVVRPELILLDVCMPICDGAQFRQEQRRNKDWIKIPTVVMTGIAEEPVLDVAVEEALRKPIKSAELLAIAARHCHPRPLP